MSEKRFRKRVLEFTPQLDTDMPVVQIAEATCNLASYETVYDLTLRDQEDWDKSMVTTLTIEELMVLRAHIDHLIQLRENDLLRQNQRVPYC